jgi:hypothetical protein
LHWAAACVPGVDSPPRLQPVTKLAEQLAESLVGLAAENNNTTAKSGSKRRLKKEEERHFMFIA